MNLSQGMALLERTQAQAKAQTPPAQPVARIPARTALIAPPIFAVHP